MTRRVLITGVASPLAGRVARALEDRDDVAEIVGLDVRDPRSDLVRTRFVRADVRNPLVSRILEDGQIDTVLHLNASSSPAAVGGRARMKEINVIGGMQLLAACQQAPTVRRLVLRSSTAVYGSEHTDPASFSEDAAARTPPKRGFGKDAAEVEAYVRDFGRRREDVDVTILRFAPILGPQADGVLPALFTWPVVPSILGFDPRLQFCHEDDAVAVLVAAATTSHPGIFNVAGAGVMYLSQCVRLAGRIAAPLPSAAVSALASILRRTGRADLSDEQLRYLQFGRVVDTSRLREVFGYTPRWSTREAFEDFLQHRRFRQRFTSEQLRRFEDQITEMLQRARRDDPTEQKL